MSRTITDALQKVFLKLGGNVQDIQDNKTVTDYVDDLGEVLESLAELPVVTSSDNGKILKVVDGKWNKGDAPSNEPFIVTITGELDGEYTIDKTYLQTKEAYLAGKQIILNNNDDSSNCLICYDKKYDSLCFNGYINGDSTYFCYYAFSNNGEKDYISVHYESIG